MPTQLVFFSIVSVSWAIAQPFCDGGACRSLTQSPLLERESIAEKSVKNARARDSDIYDDDELAADVSMLQTLTNHEETTDEYTSAVASDSKGTNRVAWLHIPKAGTSFGTTLAHYANASLPEEAFLHDCAGRCGFQFTQDYPIDIYFRNLMWTKRRGNWADHDAITPDAWEEFKGSFFGMFREPVSWTRSAYSYFGPEVNESLSGFVARTSATATLMLSGQRHGATCLFSAESRLGHDPPPPPCTHPAADVTLALQRLDGFRFVGLTTDWLTSICLFHLKFGGPCNSNELTNARPTNVARPTTSWNVNISQVELENVVAETDNPDKIIYARAKAIFDADVMKYGATDARCAQLCKPNDTAAGAVRHAAEDQTAIGSAEAASEEETDVNLERLPPERLLELEGLDKEQVEIVMARHAEDVTWSNVYKNIRTLYCNGNTIEDPYPPEDCVHVPNVGREGAIYLRHIVTHYDNLSQWTVFTQAQAPTENYQGHRREGGHMLPGTRFSDYVFSYDSALPEGGLFFFTRRIHLLNFSGGRRESYNSASPKSHQAPPTICPNAAGTPSDYWMGMQYFGWFRSLLAEKCNSTFEDIPRFVEKYWREVLDLPAPHDGVVYYAQGARFAVSRERIRGRPKEYYQRLLNLIDTSADPCYNYFNEWAWYYMLGHSNRTACNDPRNHLALDAIRKGDEPPKLWFLEPMYFDSDGPDKLSWEDDSDKLSWTDDYKDVLARDEGSELPNETAKRVQLFGMYNSGTNMIVATMQASHPDASVCPFGQMETTKAHCQEDQSQSPYKHANVHFVQEWLSKPSSQGSRLIFVVRNPVSWLASMKNSPYGFGGCFNPNATEWVSQECRCEEMVEMGKKDLLCAPGQASYSSMADVWNRYVAGYKQLANSSTHLSTMTRYEDIVLEPVQSYETIEARLELSVRKPSFIERLPSSSVKQNGRSSEDAALAIRLGSYREGLNDEDRKTFCSLLDKTLLQEFGYVHECLPNSVHPIQLVPSQLVWLHVPKSGTSFGNAVITYACDGLLDGNMFAPSEKPGNHDLGIWLQTGIHFHQCRALANATERCGEHEPLTTDDTCVNWQRRQAVGMFRQPEQRILSAYYHTGVLGIAAPWGVDKTLSNMSLDDYKTLQAGCATRMLTGDRCLPESHPTQPINNTVVDLAKERLRSFAFVGLTEEWDLSVCLFSVMTGSSCHKRMFPNVRPGRKHESGRMYDVRPLNGFKDIGDGMVYEEAKKIFYQQLDTYGVTLETCARVCGAAGRFS